MSSPIDEFHDEDAIADAVDELIIQRRMAKYGTRKAEWWSEHHRGYKPDKGLDSIWELYPGSELTAEQVEFGRAMDQYMRAHDRPFPTWLEVLNVAKELGYRKVL